MKKVLLLSFILIGCGKLEELKDLANQPFDKEFQASTNSAAIFKLPKRTKVTIPKNVAVVSGIPFQSELNLFLGETYCTYKVYDEKTFTLTDCKGQPAFQSTIVNANTEIGLQVFSFSELTVKSTLTLEYLE